MAWPHHYKLNYLVHNNKELTINKILCSYTKLWLFVDKNHFYSNRKTLLTQAQYTEQNLYNTRIILL